MVYAAFLGIASARADEPVQGRASIVDGDTIEIQGRKIRLFGIDAPESGQLCFDAQQHPWRCGQRAAWVLAELIGEQTVFCLPKGKDRYDRIVAVCRSGTDELNRLMVRRGWALAYREYGGRIYDQDEDLARATRVGIWGGQFDPPWEWRKAIARSRRKQN